MIYHAASLVVKIDVHKKIQKYIAKILTGTPVSWTPAVYGGNDFWNMSVLSK